VSTAGTGPATPVPAAFPWYTVQALEAAGPDEAAATAVKPPAISQAAAARVSGARGSPPMATR
jgi:hypothetical protein